MICMRIGTAVSPDREAGAVSPLKQKQTSLKMIQLPLPESPERSAIPDGAPIRRTYSVSVRYGE